MAEQSSSGSERTHLSVPRVPLRDFLQEAGCHLFPAQWPDSFPSDPHGSDEVGMSIVGRVERELNYALSAGLIPIEVDLLRLPENDRMWAEDEEGIRYFKLLNSSFKSFSEVDWRKSTVRTNPDQFTPVDLILSSILEEDIYELNGYVRDPAGTLKDLLISIQSEIDYDRLELARQHHWAEIMAVMWRDVAQKGSLDAHGSIKRVISAVGAYYESRRETNTPSEGQLRDAVFWMKEQLISSSSKEQVIPNFSEIRAKQKQNSRRT